MFPSKQLKKQISMKSPYLFTALFFIHYFMEIQTAVTLVMYKQIPGKPVPASYIPVFSLIDWCFLIAIFFSLNISLFWTKENQKGVLVLRKYDTIPVSSKDLYLSRISLIFHYHKFLFLGILLIYYIFIFANFGTLACWLPSLFPFLKVLVGSFSISGILLFIDFLYDLYTRP